jgi:DNA-binding LacI/PurR family transcriptional regulator
MRLANGRGRPNQGDIAAQLGVSISTVSRALANEPGISEQVRGDVLKAARALGYRSKHAGPASHGRRAVALVPLGSAASAMSGFYVGIVEGMRATALEMGVDLDVRLVNEHAVTLETIERQVTQAEADAVLLAGIDTWDGLAEWLEANAVAAVLVNGIDPKMRVSSVAPANFFGAYQATRRLLEAGHRRILHYGQPTRPTLIQRWRGFEAAMADTPGAEGRVVTTAERSTIELLDDILDGKIDATALFAWNDIAAVEMLEGLHGGGKTLPTGFSIVGFDGLPIAEMTTPRLSTMYVDREAIGAGAVRLLVQQMSGDSAVQHLEIGVTSVAGGTVFQLEK